MNSGDLDPLTQIRILLAKENFEEAMNQLRQIVDSENSATMERAKAFTQLGWIYEIGRGVEANLEQAAKYFTRGAELGDPESMYSIAVMYLTGKGKPLDKSLGDEWLLKSAHLNFPKAVDKLNN